MKLGFECYVRKYNIGEVDHSWHIHFYDKNMESSDFGISNNGYELEERCERYLYIKYMKENYNIDDMLPLKNSKWIILY